MVSIPLLIIIIIIIITCAFRINANGSFTCCCGLSDNEDIGKLVKKFLKLSIRNPLLAYYQTLLHVEQEMWLERVGILAYDYKAKIQCEILLPDLSHLSAYGDCSWASQDWNKVLK